MESVLQPVLAKFPQYFIERQKSPTYVEMYTKINNDIVMVYVKSKPNNNNMIGDAPGKPINNEREELELTGSPLKLDLSLHTILDETLMSDEPQLWSKEEIVHGPVDIETAREIANTYNSNRAEVNSENAIPLWILTNPSDNTKPLLLTVQSDNQHFARGIVTYEGNMVLDDIDLDNLVEEYAGMEGLTGDLINVSVDCKYLISGVSYRSHNAEELVNAPHNGVTQLRCEWVGRTLYTPYISCKVYFEQEVIIGHLMSPCNVIWESVCALHNMNQLLVDMTAAGYASVDLNTAIIRNTSTGTQRANNTKRLNELLSETESYEYTRGRTAPPPAEPATLRDALAELRTRKYHNDFTYKLWDIFKDCETAEELVTLLIQALKFISSGKIRPFIDANNKTYLSKLVLKLSRGHSQATKVLKNLRASPPQAISLVAQVGMEKTMWEYTKIMSLLEHSFFIAGIWSNDARTHESIEQINQTIQDMTMSGGEFSLNPFESLAGSEHSIRLDCESFCDEESNELTVEDFASLKMHGLVMEKKDVNEVPLIADEIDISPWKHLLSRFAQVHACLEHLHRAQAALRTDFASLKPISTRLLEHYVSEKSPVKTVGQLLSDPLLAVAMKMANNVVQDHLKKPAFWYRVEMTRKEAAAGEGTKRESKLVYAFTQQPVFPPAVWHLIEPPMAEVAEVTSLGEELKYYCTKYTFLSNKQVNKLCI